VVRVRPFSAPGNRGLPDNAKLGARPAADGSKCRNQNAIPVFVNSMQKRSSPPTPRFPIRSIVYFPECLRAGGASPSLALLSHPAQFLRWAGESRPGTPASWMLLTPPGKLGGGHRRGEKGIFEGMLQLKRVGEWQPGSLALFFGKLPPYSIYLPKHQRL
jgi:hypothetical protein